MLEHRLITGALIPSIMSVSTLVVAPAHAFLRAYMHETTSNFPIKEQIKIPIPQIKADLNLAIHKASRELVSPKT